MKSLLLAHELALLMLVLVTVATGLVWGYMWHQSSRESFRLNALGYEAQQTRSSLFRQISEVTQARLTENPYALEVYQTFTRRIQGHLNNLRRNAANQSEELAIQEIERSYRQIQQDMNRVFTDPYLPSDSVRMKILSPRYESGFEAAVASFMDLLARESQVLERKLDRFTRLTTVLLPLLLVVAVGLVLWSRRSVQTGFVRPVQDLIQGAQVISKGDFEYRVPTDGVEEMVNLSEAINRMAEELASSRDALVEKETQAALGALVPVVAHNIRNPLATIRAHTQLLDTDDEDVREARQAIIETVDRLERWVSSLLSYLHPLTPHPSASGLVAILEAALSLLKQRIESKGVKVVWRGREQDRVVSVDVALMEQAFYGLLTNALDASPREGRVTIGIKRFGGQLTISIEDQGSGLSFEPRPQGLKPGPSTKVKGTGLGIPFAFKVCQAHGWYLSFDSGKGGGTTARISIPAERSVLASTA